MNMVSLSGLTAALQFEYQDAPPGLIEQAIISAAQELCQRPLLQQTYDLTSDLQGCESDYSVEDYVPEGLEVSGILSVEYCGCCIKDIDPKCNPCAHGWSLCDDSTITLHPEVGESVAGQDLKICVALRPCADACKLPDVLLKKFERELKWFARSELSATPNTTFFDARYAQFAGRKAKSLMRRAQAHTARNKTHKGIRKASAPTWLL